MVLDMCAAPGSKTLECLELMRLSVSDNDIAGGAENADAGVVVANDADAERTFELLPLITRKARHAGTIVTLANAAKFPPVMSMEPGHDNEQVLFDRIVCDVPCCGDGTLRKHPHAWSLWRARNGLTFHGKQLRLLSRGLHLLRPGGRLAYSTCSLNPIENEAVVAAALHRFGNDVRLVAHPAADLQAKGLSVSHGLATWGVPDPCSQEGVQLFQSWLQVPESLKHPRDLLYKSMFPPWQDGDTEALAYRSMLVEGCVRLNPQRIDGSGFFIAIFEKIKHRCFPCEPNTSEVKHGPPTKSSSRIPWRARNEANHYELVDETSAVVKEIAQFYGLSRTPGPLLAEFNTKGRLTQLNLVNESLRRFLQGQPQCKASPLVISVGVPLFKPLPDGFMTEVQLPCRWRPALEGSGLLAPLMTKRALQLDESVLRKLLAERILPMQELYALADSEDVVGVGSCEGLLGGVVAGLPDGSFWTPCVVTGQGLELFANAEELGVPAPELLPPQQCSVLLEGHGYVVLQKPPGLRSEDALDELRRRRAPHAELVSRLDRDTSGCLLVPTTSASASALSAQFAGNKVQKMYLALVQGVPPPKGVIDAPLALAELGGGSRYRAYVDDEKGKSSETIFRTLWSGARVALVEAQPVTGRTHQIRCHLAHVGFPLVGDRKYGAEGPTPAWCTRLPLHCLHMLAKDELGAAIDVLAPPPEDFVAMLEPAALKVLAAYRDSSKQ